MTDYKHYFNGKKITLMGLGLLGRGLGDAIFLAENGAELIVTDLRDEKTLAPSLAKLKKYRNIRYTLGQHTLEDFRDRDFILKAAGVSLDSPFIVEARKNKIPIEMDASLFAKLAPKGITVVGVTGTRGKSTTTALIYELVKATGKRVWKGGNLVLAAMLPLLEKVRAGDTVVLELDSWQLQGFHDVKISPQVAVFTNFLDDHLVYYKGDRKRYLEDKSAIFQYQKKGDVFIVGEQASNHISSGIVARAADVPKDWKVKLLGEHNRANIACAIAAARSLGVSDSVMKRVVEGFKGVSGRLEYLRTIRGVKIYNDNNATTPDATIAALKALGEICRSLTPTAAVGVRLPTPNRNIILICGGTDKGLDMSNLVAEIPKYCKAVVMLKESGTEKIKKSIQGVEKDTLKECVAEVMKLAKTGDILLFSPAFASFGKWFKNEYDRGNQFIEIIKCLK